MQKINYSFMLKRFTQFGFSAFSNIVEFYNNRLLAQYKWGLQHKAVNV